MDLSRLPKLLTHTLNSPLFSLLKGVHPLFLRLVQLLQAGHTKFSLITLPALSRTFLRGEG
jgi:hypothetical protein